MAQFSNNVLVSDAVSSLAAALSQGDKAESAIVDSVIAVTFMAMEQVGRDYLGKDNMDADKSLKEIQKDVKARVNGCFLYVAKALVMQGKRVFRDSDDAFAAHVKPHNGRTEDSRKLREKGVNSYFDECGAKGPKFKQFAAKDYVWTVSQVRSFVNKVVSHQLYNEDRTALNETGMEYARALAGLEADKQFGTWKEDFLKEYGHSFGQLNAAFTKPVGQGGDDRDAGESIINAISKVKDVATLERVLGMLQTKIQHLKATEEAAKAAGVEVTDENIGMYDDEVTVAPRKPIPTPESRVAH